MIIPLQYVAEWNFIGKRKQASIDKSNSHENATRVAYNYKIGKQVLIKITDIQRKLDCLTKGPFPIVAVHPENRNITIKG